jgi:hypothetical protein
MFTLVHQYKYTLSELEMMIPWERDMYINFINEWVKEQEENTKQQKDKVSQDLRSILKPKPVKSK